jgi:hypothetical protein
VQWLTLFPSGPRGGALPYLCPGGLDPRDPPNSICLDDGDEVDFGDVDADADSVWMTGMSMMTVESGWLTDPTL